MNKIDNIIFCPPPPGKPNPQQPYNPEKPRDRVAQAGQKGETCFYYAMNMLRQRIGKKATAETERLRDTEIKISTIRKKLTAVDQQYAYHFSLVKNLMQKCQCKSLNRNDVKRILARTILRLNNLFREKHLSLLKTFTDQNEVDDLLDYTDNQLSKECTQIKLEFTETFWGGRIKDFYSSLNVLDKEWDSLSVKERAWMCDVLFRFCLIEQYGLTRAEWNPNQTIDNLFQDLKERGPLLVCGHHGKGFYDSAPFQLADSISGRPIFGWKPNSPRLTEGRMVHAVVVVGVNLDKKVVYFLDPRDSSGPSAKDQKVYVVSYERFKSATVNFVGLQESDKNGKVVHSNKGSFAYYSAIRDPSL